jgi:hypothetical protein
VHAFSEDVLWLAEPTPDKSRVRVALSRLRAAGATSVYDALYAGILLSEGPLRPLIVLFTDGEDNTSWLREADLRVVASRSNVLVHVVGWRPPQSPAALRVLPRLTESPQDRALREIAEAAGGRCWNADSPDRLRQAFAAIADAMGHRYVLRYEPEGVARAGWHRIEARLRGCRRPRAPSSTSTTRSSTRTCRTSSRSKRSGASWPTSSPRITACSSTAGWASTAPCW